MYGDVVKIIVIVLSLIVVFCIVFRFGVRRRKWYFGGCSFI